ncbi:MAG: hypothetical protein ACPG7F_06205 [Aggregatilineales bacterium]
MLVLHAIYRDGKLELSEDAGLQEGQQVQVQIIEKAPDVDIRALISDMLVTTSYDYDDNFDEAAVIEDLDRALTGLRPLSEIIIEEREN